jgi:UDP-N-acetylglucosamine kinase
VCSGRLDPVEHARTFREEILPALAGPRPQDAPLAVLLGGQPGIGKSSTKAALVAALRGRGGTLDVSTDLLRPFHPRFPELLVGDERVLAELDGDIDLDARAWLDLAFGHAIGQRVNVVVDSNLADPARAAGFAARFAAADYRVEVVFVAGPAALSRLGVLQRYQSQVDQLGHGAYCPTPIQDRNYAGVLDTADMLDRTVSVDLVVVQRRGGARLHRQDRTAAGEWDPAPGARQAIQAERDRSWSDPEQQWFLAGARSVAAHVDDAHLPDLHDACVLALPLVPPSAARTHLEQLITALADRCDQLAASASTPREASGRSLVEVESRWRPVLEAIDRRITGDPSWLGLAVTLERARAAGLDVVDQLAALVAAQPLPDEHPAVELRYRLVAAHPAAGLLSAPLAGPGSPAPPPTDPQPPAPSGGRGVPTPRA